MSTQTDSTIWPEALAGERVVVAMSGGVDSSVVAAMLAEQACDPVGISMRLYKSGNDGPAKGCCSPDDLFDARSVATALSMPFYVVNYQEAFQKRVIDHFIDEYRRGRTPSPCVLCNDHLKFDTLIGFAESVGAARLATGHYARIERDEDGGVHLLRGVDERKDQSYFLFGIRKEVLPQLLFPLGAMNKAEVRALAERFGLPTANKAESQDLCFVGGHYRDFLDKRLLEDERVPGDIVHAETDQVLGRHEGIHRYTIGQRKGLGVGGAGGPLYVVGIDPESGRVRVGPRDALFRRDCEISRCNWLNLPSDGPAFSAQVKVRYRHNPVPALVEVLDDDRARIVFEQPEPAVAPGQAAVVYNGDEVLGGGWIDSPR